MDGRGEGVGACVGIRGEARGGREVKDGRERDGVRNGRLDREHG